MTINEKLLLVEALYWKYQYEDHFNCRCSYMKMFLDDVLEYLPMSFRQSITEEEKQAVIALCEERVR